MSDILAITRDYRVSQRSQSTSSTDIKERSSSPTSTSKIYESPFQFFSRSSNRNLRSSHRLAGSQRQNSQQSQPEETWSRDKVNDTNELSVQNRRQLTIDTDMQAQSNQNGNESFVPTSVAFDGNLQSYTSASRSTRSTTANFLIPVPSIPSPVSTTKILFYAGHDATLVPLIVLLGIYNGKKCMSYKYILNSLAYG